MGGIEALLGAVVGKGVACHDPRRVLDHKQDPDLGALGDDVERVAQELRCQFVERRRDPLAAC